MAPLRRFFLRLYHALFPNLGERELAREITAHLGLIEEEFRRRGATPEAAQVEARRLLGSVQRTTELHRDERSFPWIEDLRRDVRHAVRALGRTPGFTVVAVLTLALGIGATSAIFTVVNATLLKPLPYPDADRLVRLMMSVPAAGSPSGAPLRTAVGLSAIELAEVQARTQALSHVGTAGPTLAGLSGHEEAARLQGARISASSLRILGAQSVLGRLFTPADELPDAEGVILISSSVWRRHFGGDPHIVGRSVTLDSVLGPRRQSRYTVAGVLSDGFDFGQGPTEFWIPFELPAPGGGNVLRGPLLGQLADGVSLEAAALELVPLIRDIRRGRPGSDVATYELVRQQDELVARVRPALIVLSGAVGFLLLIACINVMNLLLARAAGRQRELAVRAALGAGRGRIVRLLLTESLLLAGLGALAGMVVTIGGVRLLRALATSAGRFDLGTAIDFPRLADVTIDAPVVVFTCLTAVMTGTFFGLIPSLRHSRLDTIAHLRKGGGATTSGVSRLGIRTGLVVAEIAAAMVLLVGGALLIRSFANLLSVDTGYSPSNVLTFQVSVPLNRYPDERLKTFAEDLVTQLRRVPGIAHAAYANQLPMVQLRDTVGGLWKTPDPDRKPTPEGPDARLVSWDYLPTMGIRIVNGRGFLESDGEGQPRVILINEALARQQFATQDPVGQLVYVGRDTTPWEIVGVVDDVRQFALDQNPQPQFFLDVRQWPQARGVLFPVGAYYAIRTAGDPIAMVAQVRRVIRELDPESALFNTSPMERLVAATISRPRLHAAILGIFAAVGVALAVIGVYGVMAFAVAQRTREIGIRIALGAQRRKVMGDVLGQSMVLTLIGIALGLTGSTALTRYFEGLLFGVTPLDSDTVVAVTLLFVGVAMLATYAPARRAASVDPLVALRTE